MVDLQSAHKFIGIHVIAEIFGVEYSILNDCVILNKMLYGAALSSSVHILGTLVKTFDPQGVSILYLLSESHISIHTYPEHTSIFFDAFTCGTVCDPNLILQTFCQQLSPSDVKKTVLVRK